CSSMSSLESPLQPRSPAAPNSTNPMALRVCMHAPFGGTQKQTEGQARSVVIAIGYRLQQWLLRLPAASGAARSENAQVLLHGKEVLADARPCEIDHTGDGVAGMPFLHGQPRASAQVPTQEQGRAGRRAVGCLEPSPDLGLSHAARAQPFEQATEVILRCRSQL